MKLHLFKVEQFFPEPMVLEAELKYPLASIQTTEVKGNTITYQSSEHTISLKLDNSGEFITQVNCSCNQFSQSEACIHIIMASWEYRKNGMPDSLKGSRKTKGYQISTLIDQVPERELKQFISGYAQKNSEFRQLIKLLFSHELDNFISFDEVYVQLERVFDLYKSKLDVKKYQRKLAFYIRTFLGVAEDLLMQKDYRTALFYNLSAWEIWVEHPSHFRKLNDENQIYDIILKIFKRIENSEISPDLYKFMVNALNERIGQDDFIPIKELDVPEMMIAWEIWEEDRYDSFVLKKFRSSFEPENWTTRVVNIIHDKSADIQSKVISKMQKIGRDQILRKVTQHYSAITPEDYLFLRRAFTLLKREQLHALERLMPPNGIFLLKLDFLVQYREMSLIDEILYDQEYNSEQKKYVRDYLVTQSIPAWIEYLVRRIILDNESPIIKLKSIEEPKEWIHLLPHIRGENKEEVIQMIRDYCFQYAEEHIGMRAKKHLQSIGRLLKDYGFENIWLTIKNELMDRFAHRRSFQSMDNPFS